jgi:hypothetical protein
MFQPVTNFTPHEPLIKIIKIEDNLDDWGDDVTDHVNRIFSVYVYDARLKVHVASYYGSRELHFLSHDFTWKEDNPDEDTQEKVHDLIDSVRCDDIIYWNPRGDIEEIEEGYLPEGKTGQYKLYQAGAWEPEKRDAEDKADAEYKEKTKEEWKNVHHGEETEQAVAAWKEEGNKKTAEAIEEAREWACTTQP